jgi:hypothetical protein
VPALAPPTLASLHSPTEGFPSAWLPVNVLAFNAHTGLVQVQYQEIKEADDDASPLLKEELKAERCVLYAGTRVAATCAVCFSSKTVSHPPRQTYHHSLRPTPPAVALPPPSLGDAIDILWEGTWWEAELRQKVNAWPLQIYWLSDKSFDTKRLEEFKWDAAAGEVLSLIHISEPTRLM